MKNPVTSRRRSSATRCRAIPKPSAPDRSQAPRATGVFSRAARKAGPTVWYRFPQDNRSMYRQKRHGCPAMPLPRQAIARPARNGLHSTKRVPVSRFALHRRKARVTACPVRFAQRSDEPSRNPINTPPHRTRKAGTPNNVRTGRTGGTSRRTAPRRDNGGYTLRQEAKRSESVSPHCKRFSGRVVRFHRASVTAVPSKDKFGKKESFRQIASREGSRSGRNKTDKPPATPEESLRTQPPIQ